jgi:hypothetical protein
MKFRSGHRPWRAGWAPAALLLLHCSSPPSAERRPGENVPPDVARFVAEHDLSGLFDASVLVAIPDEGLLLFTVQYATRQSGLYQGVVGVRYGDRIGWVAPVAGRLPGRARRHVFGLHESDAYLFSEAFEAIVREAAPAAWRSAIAPMLTANLATPRGTLLRLAETDDAPYRPLFERAVADDDLRLLLALRFRAHGKTAWNRATLDALERRLRAGTLTDGEAELLFSLLPSTGEAEVATLLLEHPRMLHHEDLLVRMAMQRDPEFAEARQTAMDRLVRGGMLSEWLLERLEWWETHPELIHHPLVQGRPRLLRAARRADTERFALIVLEAERALLDDPETPADVVAEIARGIVRLAERCTAPPYPLERHARRVLAHPRAAEREAIPYVFAHTDVLPSIRARASEMVTGRPATSPPPGWQRRVAERRLTQVHVMAGSLLEGAGYAPGVAHALETLDRWEAAGVRRAEMDEWRRVLRETPPEELPRLVSARGEPMEQLRSFSPLVVLVEREVRELLLGRLLCDLPPL